MDHRRSTLWWCCCLGAALGAAPVAARPVEATDTDRYMRTAEEPGRSVALEVAARTFDRAGGPTVALVGVAHIGEEELYESLQRLLDEHDVVLYESVKPAGTGGAGGDDDGQRIESTRAALDFVAGVLAAYRQGEHRYPQDLEELSAFAVRHDPRMAAWLAAARTDGWGEPVRYRAVDDRSTFRLESLGADRRPGGEGAAADLRVTQGNTAPLALGRGEDNLQAELAKALDLEFQLEALDYNRPHFRCSDLAMDQIERAFRAKGVDFGPLEGSLAGTSLPGRLVIFLLRMMRVLDIFFDGMIADVTKVFLIEAFSSEEILELSLEQLGEEFESVIIDQRNQVVVDDVKAILEREGEVDSIAILYGAAHMPDMARRLTEQLGYGPAGVQWFTAIEVDLTQSAVSPKQIENFRRMFRQQLRSMLPREQQPVNSAPEES